MLDQKPNFTLNEAKHILKEFYNKTITEITSLQSERDQNFFIKTTTKQKFVLKISNFLELYENIALQNRVIDYIKDLSTFNHPKIIKFNDKGIFKFEKDNKYFFIRLVAYVEGIPLASYKPVNKAFCFLYGKFLAHLTNSIKDFKDFDNTFKTREFYWDIKYASDVIREYKSLLKDLNKASIINYFLLMFENSRGLLMTFSSSIIHNDANDNNVIISKTKTSLDFGIIDFGDMVYSYTIINLAVGIAYLILGKRDPIQIIRETVRGYNEIIKLSESELKIIFSLIAIRLTMSVCISAYQQTIEPENAYLSISENSAWETLSILKHVNPLWIEFILRAECGYTPSNHAVSVKEWILKQSKSSKPIIDISYSKLELINLEISSSLGTFNELTDQMFKSKIIENFLNSNFRTAGIVPSHISRIDYLGNSHSFTSNEKKLFKNYSPSLEIYSLENLDVYNPFDGELFKIIISSMNLFTIILEHKTDSGETFYSIFSNIYIKNLTNLVEGSILSRGSNIGKLLNLRTNPYPLKFQILCANSIGLYQESFLHREKFIVDEIFFKPEIFISKKFSNKNSFDYSLEDIERKRKVLLGSSLSVSYSKHLHIIRGSDQYLLDNNSLLYLDAVNNVPHVGHNNISVVNSLINQVRVLNTNTRYLHETIIKFAEKLTSKLPEKLQVCFFVNSGSEANELALRLSENYTNKKGIAVLDHAYHGNTSKLIEISPYKHNGPGGKGTPKFVHVLTLADPYRGKYKRNDDAAGDKYFRDEVESVTGVEDIGTFIFESYPGVAGQIVLAKGYLQKLCSFFQEHNVICIADEVQIGLGRSGSNYWGFQNHNIQPDIVTIGKPLGNGHPLGAVITTKEIADTFNNGMEYFNTFGGNPVSCAVGLAVLDEIDTKKLQNNASIVGSYLMNQLQNLYDKYQLIGDIRGTGLYIGIEFVRSRETLEPADWETSYIVERLKESGILVSTDGIFHNVIKIKPPLIFTKENALELTNKLEIILQDTILKL